ncbi:MAG TPA: hypothetical protein VES01_05275 [Dermatophilaceae bacterium]|nr:hypothetical protein [Dermatophilaceae bacterium]
MSEELERTGRARRAAELALVRVCSHYGERPNFVLLGGLVPAMLCTDSGRLHADTTDVDVQVDLEIAGGAEHARRLEIALKNADFRVDSERVWCWETVQGGGYKAVIKFELLADLDDQPQSANVHFASTDKLGAVNLRGTGYASRDFAPRTLVAYDQGARITAEVNVTGLAGFLLAKTAAAYGRHKAKDYYDIAFVLFHHNEVFDETGPLDPADVVLQRLGAPVGMRSAIEDLTANFSDDRAQGVEAYVEQLLINNPELDPVIAATDARLAVAAFTRTLLNAITG